MKEDSKKKQIVKISVFITSIFIIFLSVTYAFINQTLVGTKRQVITSGNLELELLEDENNLAITDALPMYDEVGMIQDAFTFRLVNKTSMDTNYILKLDEIAVEGGLLREDVKYGLTKDGEVTIDLVSNIVDNTIDEGVILGNQTIEYSLRLWVKDSVTDISRIQNKSMRFKVNMSASQKVEEEVEEGVPVGDKAFASENLGDACKTYNDGVDTFLVGQCSQNYVWYSGKLWRVVLKNNETGNVKMITDNAITTIAYNSVSTRADAKSYGAEFKNSYVQQWLNLEFLPTLHDYENYIVTDSVWYKKTVYSQPQSSLSRPSTSEVVNDAVGLLNLYEYYTTYYNSDGLATSSNNYLKSGNYWWLLTPKNDSDTWTVTYGLSNSSSSTENMGVRPVINLKSDIETSSGDGTKEKPYKLVGDEKKVIKGTTLLNTMYSGEYVSFNEQLYRIVNIEDSFTKIIAVNSPDELKKVVYNSNTLDDNYKGSTLETVLGEYYESLGSDVKALIQEDMRWYFGDICTESNGNKGACCYKKAICSSNYVTGVSMASCNKTSRNTMANIGLSRYGEMFSATKERAWILGIQTSSNIFYSSSSGVNWTRTYTSQYAVYPSLYLKSNVVIASSNTGDGTYEHPYDIELK